jgi:TetR/AcrR family transcriptional regulator, regulator of autoinduction and epiphytic fitness
MLSIAFANFLGVVMSDLADQESSVPKSPRSKTPDKAGNILAGALREFMTGGYAATSMDRIATASGVSKPTLYSYFRDKEGLFVELIQRMMPVKPKRESLKSERLLQQPLRDSLRQIATEALDQLAGPQPIPIFVLVRLIIGESGRFPGLAQAFVRNAEKPMLDELIYLFTHHPESKSKECDLEVLARCFHGSIVHYILLQHILSGHEIMPMERDRFINGLVDIIVGD